LTEDLSAFRLRDREMAKTVMERLKALGVSIRVMHVCGTHQDTLVRHGLEAMLNDAGVEIRQGPGCPVCVTTPKEIEKAMALADAGIRVAAFGDMMRVPSSSGSLDSRRTAGDDVHIVYSIEDAVELARKDGKETVFLGIGFETTSPSTAATLLADPPENFSVLSCHRVVPPALDAIIKSGEVRLDGLIEPGHVSTIIGTRPYEFLTNDYGVPQVVAGFEPLDLLMAAYMLAKQKANGEAKLENEYARVVREEGNPIALKMLDDVFEPRDVAWRGFPAIPRSGCGIRAKFESWDAEKKHQDILAPVEEKDFPEPEGCLCGEVLRGVTEAKECPMFGTGCTPEHPVGPCMVSAEGSCNILYRYGGQ